MLEYHPERIYLTHFGEVDRPNDKIGDFKDWVANYVNLSEQFNPVDQESTKKLEQALRQLTIDKLGKQAPNHIDAILTLMSSDIRLNAEGLSIWWKSQNNV